ncbi:MAG: hypothetical protein Nk1A_2020 [Endomicrobiia bacterium]|nr:MAG: hypothetical protein Nk1A_2020 [Endomicrobiia bacterium]
MIKELNFLKTFIAGISSFWRSVEFCNVDTYNIHIH